MSRRRILGILGLSLGALVGCGDDGASGTDAAPADAATDASIPDAGPPDAFNPCPGKSTFQAGMTDWETGDNVAGVSVTEGDTANTATSAPNGRVVLCIESTGPVELHISHATYVDRVHTTTGEIAAEQYAANWSHSFRLITSAHRATLYASDGKTPDLAKTTVIAMVADRADGAGAAGVSIVFPAAHEGAYLPTADVDVLVAGTTSDAAGRILTLNTTAVPDSTATSVSGLSCTLPASMALEAGGFSSVDVICD